MTSQHDNRTAAASAERMWKEKAERLERANRLLTAQMRMLEEENGTLAAELNRRGANIRVRSQVALELPPALTQPLAADAPAFETLPATERTLLDELRGAAPVVFLVRSGSAVDVGNWLRRRPLWLATTVRELILFSAGKQPYCEKIPFAGLHRSLYNHVTGTLVLAPAPETRTKHIALAPLDACQALAQIYAEVKENDHD